MVFQYPKCALYLFSWESTPNENSTPVYYLPMQTSKDCADVPGNLFHRLLLLKLDKQIGGTIYQPILAANEACHMEGVGCHVGGGGVQ